MLVKIVTAELENKLAIAHMVVNRGPFNPPYAMDLTLCEVSAIDSDGRLEPVKDVDRLAQALPSFCVIEKGNAHKTGLPIIHIKVSFVDEDSREGDAVYEEEPNGDTVDSYRAPTDKLYEQYRGIIEDGDE